MGVLLSKLSHRAWALGCSPGSYNPICGDARPDGRGRHRTQPRAAAYRTQAGRRPGAACGGKERDSAAAELTAAAGQLHFLEKFARPPTAPDDFTAL